MEPDKQTLHWKIRVFISIFRSHCSFVLIYVAFFVYRIPYMVFLVYIGSLEVWRNIALYGCTCKNVVLR